MKKTTLLILAVLSLLTCLQAKDVVVKFKKTPDEIFTNPRLREFLKNNPKCSILLRTPSASGSISKGESVDLKYNNEFYAYIERAFIIDGFQVRDRAIYEKVASQGTNLDYSKMGELTNTDLILEIINVQEEVYYTNEVILNGESKAYPRCKFGGFYGWRVDCKIILVKTNEVAGIYTFYRTPCSSKYGCDFRLGKVCNLVHPKVHAVDANKKPIPWMFKLDMEDGYRAEDFGTTIGNKIILEMKKEQK